ncbi:carboxypeptidase regulatory-like domain-containing protein [Tunturibacter empetritectus]|uniref:Carboxypeptidase regulatory-like domain-containing protein n=1 Tax=Tunturiibacter empetritectus TaxID=3069691 RepID=A0AAU7ZBT3_9BACT
MPVTQPASSAPNESTPSMLTRCAVNLPRLCRLLFIALLIGIAAISSATLLAQSDNSSIAGVVTDPSGAAVGAAAITVISEQTGAEHQTISNKSGFYTIAGLAPGKYTVKVVSPGFDTVTRTNNNLDPAIPATVNVSLVVGKDNESIEITANETTLQADSSTLGRVITSSQADNLPLNGRNPIYLALTKAGITSITSTVSSSNFSTGLGAIDINGARERDNLLTYDGAVAVRIRASGDSVGTPDLDAVEEVQVLSTNYPAEYGRSIGGQIRIITKSGTDHFHGSAYEYFQNPVLNANTWVRNANANNSNPNYPEALKTNKVAPFTYNQFGFVLDGPLYIPHVLPKRKVFFLYSEAFVRNPSLSTETDTVPNAAFRNGDFSSVAQHIKDPTSGLPCDPKAGGPGCFPGNVIPKDRLSPNGVGLLNAFPTPTPGFKIGAANLLETAHYPIQQQIDSGNLDILPTEKDYIRFRLIHFYYHEVNPFATSNYDIVPRIYSRPNQTGSLDYVHTFGPSTTNEFLFTASHDVARLSIDTSTGTYNRTAYGINYPYLFPSGKDLPNKIPTIAFDTTGITTLDGSTYPSHSQGEIFDFADTVTRIISNHTLRGGVLFERAGENDDDQIAFANSTPGQTNNQNGKFDFSSTNTNGTGYDLADAALGIFNTYSEIGPRNETPSRANMFEFFAQDSWKATPKLHLEFGLRYTSIHPFYSIWNNAGTFDPAFYNSATAVKVNPTTGNPIAGSGNPLDGTVLFGNGFPASANAHVPIAVTGQYNNLFHNLPRGYVHVQKFLFQPRVGVAYSLNNKTVLRTGFGRYTSRQGTSDNVFLGGFAPLQQVVSITGGSVDNPAGTAIGTGSFPTLSGDINQQSPQPEAYIWSVSVERDLGFDTVADVSYVGRHSLHQQFESDVNQAPIGTAQAFGTSGVNAHRPYLGYAAITEVYQGDTAFYQGLQIDVNHRFSHSLGFGVAYTYAHSRDCGSFQKNILPNADDPKGLCGTADYDLRQVLVLNSVYHIPFRSSSRIANEALGGWQLSQAYQFQTGTPLNVATSQDIAGVGPGFQGQFLQIAPGASLRGNGKFSVGKDNNSWFNASAFSLPAAGTFTPQHNRNLIYGPGQASFNASLQKRFATFEGQALSFRFDAFNFPNHPNWAAPDSTYTDATFGKVTSKTGQRAMQASLRYSF